MVTDISPKELKAKLDAGEDITVVDVREDWEVKLGKIPQALHIPMGDVTSSLDQISEDKPVVFVCHSGARSQAVADWVVANGYDDVWNMTGGMERWSTDVDPSVKRY